MNENKNLKKGLGIHARRFIAYIVLILVTFACLFWLYVLFINATRSNGELQAGFTPLPSTHLLENWNNLVHGTLPVWQGMINSLIVSVLSAALCTYFSTMTAYAIHAYDFKLKKYIYAFILAVMMIPTQVTALGFVKLVGTLKMEDTFIPLIVPTIAAPVTFFYMKQYMESTLPVSLIEAARIDGASELYTFHRIAIPIMSPGIATMSIMGFIGGWNAYLLPMIILNKNEKFTLPVMMATLRASTDITANQGAIYLAVAISVIPILLVFAFFSKYIISSISAGAVKE